MRFPTGTDAVTRPLGRPVRATVCALILVACAALGTPRDAAAAGSNLFGVAALDTPSASEFQRMARGGVRICRVAIYWADAEPTAGAPRRWVKTDDMFNAAASAGVKLLPLLHGSPPWVNSNFQRPPLDAAWQRDSWSRFLRDFAARYGRGGAFWQQHPSLPYLPATDYQIWNEPNLRFFWGGKPRPRRYLALLRISSEALRAADPDAGVVTGGLFEHARTGFGIPAAKYLESLYRIRGSKRYFDAVGLHPYAPKPGGVVENVKHSRAVMTRHRDARTPIWITEVGWTTGGTGWKSSPFRATRAQQARRLTATYRLLRKQRGLRLRRVLWFSWRDQDHFPGVPDPWLYFMGLFDLNGQPRPAWFAYARAAGGQP